MVSEVVDTVGEEGSTHSFIRTHSLTVNKWRFVRMNCTTPEQVKEKLKRIKQLEKKEGKDWTVTPVFLF